VQNLPGSKQLALVNIASKTIKKIYAPSHLGSNLFGLIFKNNKVLFIEQYSEKRTLKTLDVATLQVQTLNENIATTHLQKTANGIILTSSHSGVDNLYLSADLNDSSDINTSQVLTNTQTRILDGDIDPLDKTLYYSEQRDNGVYIYAQPEEKWRSIKKAPQVMALLEVPVPTKIQTPTNDTLTGKEEDFSSWPYMLPRYWMPFGYILDGGMSFQGTTGGADPLGKNAYTLMGEWDTLTKKAGVSFDYANTSTPIELDFDASRVYRYSYSTESTIQDTSFGLAGNFKIPFMWRSWTAGLGWRHSITDILNNEYRRSGPLAHISYNSAVRRGYQISPLSGTGFSLVHQSFIESLGNVGYDKTNLSFTQFFPSFFENHAFMFQVNGTYAPHLKTKSPIFYTSTIGGNYFTNQLVQPFLVRGYNSGNLLGYNMAAATLEYRFPIARVYKGWDTVPLFVRRIHGAFVSDVVGLDGYRYSVEADHNNVGPFLRSQFGKEWYMGYGAEMNIDCTIGYYLPVTFTFGLYHGEKTDVAKDDLSYFFTFKY
jgi:hypothetical protein